MLGNVIKTLVNGSRTAGSNTVEWNATDTKNETVSAGLYVFAIQSGELKQTKKMLLVK
jgi:flagellar hook assembly protein FlgD